MALASRPVALKVHAWRRGQTFVALASRPVALKVHALASRPNFCGFGLETCGLEGPRLGVEAKLLWLWPRDMWP